jgi:hypothetical protein
MQRAVQIAAHCASSVNFMQMLSHKVFMQQAVQIASSLLCCLGQFHAITVILADGIAGIFEHTV